MSKLYEAYQKQRIDFWDKQWEKRQNRKGWGSYYHRRLLKVYKFLIPGKACVLEIGCGNGKLIGNLESSDRLGIDFSPRAIDLAKGQFPDCEFLCVDLMEFSSERKFDYIIISDLLGDLWDIELALIKIKSFCHDRTRIIFNYYSRLWEIPLRGGQRLGLKKANLEQNWLSTDDVKNLLYLSEFETIKGWQEILYPFYFPGISWFFNRILAKVFFFRLFALSNFLVARVNPHKVKHDSDPSVSVVVAARNEAGHIEELIKRLPQLGKSTELIFVEGGSSDQTYEKIESEIANNPGADIKVFKQTGKGKGDAVRLGFQQAKGDIFMILDADLTVPPEKLIQFYNAIASGKGDFINGVRLVYPMQKRAMRFFNLIGNKFFSVSFSWVLGQSIKDTLCGTKVLRKSDYERISQNRKYFGEFDPFGDFDLIFGAAKLNLKIQDLPVRYQERIYGTTNISRWKHGWLLLKMLIFALNKIKFI